jgi:flagellar basal body-associated protein FliL
MSQKKVDYYKEQKANRSEIMKKEKRILMIEKIVAAVVGVFAVCWIIFSVVNKFTATDESAVETVRTAINTSALDDFIDDVAAEGAEEEASEEEAAAGYGPGICSQWRQFQR